MVGHIVADFVIVWVLGCCLALKISLHFYYTSQINFLVHAKNIYKEEDEEQKPLGFQPLGSIWVKELEIETPSKKTINPN